MEFCPSPRLPCLVLDDHPCSANEMRLQHLNAQPGTTATESDSRVAKSGYLGGGGWSDAALRVAGVGRSLFLVLSQRLDPPDNGRLAEE